MIIYWITDDKVFPLLNDNGTIKLFDSVTEADIEAEKFTVRKANGELINDSRVISIEGVQE